MKKILVIILSSLGLVSPFSYAEAPEVNTEGLVIQESIVVPEPEPEPEPDPEPYEVETTTSIGVFNLTAYCACPICCNKSDGITATGTQATAGRTIAVDPTVIPYGTEVVINGHTYVAEDCGGGIKGNHIDVFFDSHEEALAFGVQTAEVCIVQTNEN